MNINQNTNNQIFEEMKNYLDDFIAKRKWEKYRTPKNLVMALSSEVGELTELFQWIPENECLLIKKDSAKIKEIEEEMADVLSYLIQLAGVLSIDLNKAFWEKTKKNEKKHKIEEYK